MIDLMIWAGLLFVLFAFAGGFVAAYLFFRVLRKQVEAGVKSGRILLENEI